MRRGTTPTVELVVTNDDGTAIDLTDQEVHVTFKEAGVNGYRVDKRETDECVSITAGEKSSTVAVTLTQEETLGFTAGRQVEVQLRCKKLGIAIATDIGAFEAERILKEGVI